MKTASALKSMIDQFIYDAKLDGSLSSRQNRYKFFSNRLDYTNFLKDSELAAIERLPDAERRKAIKNANAEAMAFLKEHYNYNDLTGRRNSHGSPEKL